MEKHSPAMGRALSKIVKQLIKLSQPEGVGLEAIYSLVAVDCLKAKLSAFRFGRLSRFIV